MADTQMPGAFPDFKQRIAIDISSSVGGSQEIVVSCHMAKEAEPSLAMWHVAMCDADVQSANIGIHSAWRKANDCVLWQRVINTATLH